MPRKKSAPSLEELCLNVATARFEEKQIQDELVNQPPTLINNVYERLCLRTDIKYLPSNIFIYSGAVSLHHLDRFCMTVPSLYDKIGKECKNLVAFHAETDTGDLERRKASIASKIKLMPSLPKLQRLIINHTREFTDEVAAAIGKNCPLLTHLNVSCCGQLTDSGLRALSSCVQLEYLTIGSTSATVDGCLFVLNQLPKLKVFNHIFWRELLIELAQQSIRHETSRTYSIEKIPYTNHEHIPMLRIIFPNLRRLSLKDHLHLNILTWPQRLTSLCLSEVRPVNIRLIDRAWPMLERLSLAKCTILNESDGFIDAPLKNLRKLQFVFRAITEQQMTTLLVPCTRLEELFFRHCGMEVSDNLFSELIESHALQNLKI